MDKQNKIEERRSYDREWKKQAYLKNPEKFRLVARLKWKKIKENTERLKKYREYHNRYNQEYRKTEEFRATRRKYAKEWHKKNSKRIYQQRRKRPYERLASVIRARIYNVV